MRRLWLGSALALSVALSCSSGDGDDRHAAAPSTGGSSAGKGSTKAGSSNMTEAGGAGEQPADQGGAGNGGDDSDMFSSAGVPAMIPGVCKAEMEPGREQKGDFGLASGTLLGITPDELTAVLTTGEGDTLALHVADRAGPDDAFVPVAVTLPSDYDAQSGAALSSDGLQLILVMKDHSGFGALSRGARGTPFGAEADVTAFAKINGLKITTGQSVGWPVVSNDGKDLYYLSYFGQGLVHQAQLGADAVFDIGVPIDEFTLGGNAGEYKLISGISTDQRAIFFFDQATKHAAALFRSRPGAPFYDPVDLGDRRGVAPNAACDRLYSSAGGKLLLQPLN